MYGGENHVFLTYLGTTFGVIVSPPETKTFRHAGGTRIGDITTLYVPSPVPTSVNMWTNSSDEVPNGSGNSNSQQQTEQPPKECSP